MSTVDIEDGGGPCASILAVDDYPANLLTISALLDPLGREVVTASSGPEALDVAASGDFAVILLDVMMPAMDGFETLGKLRSRPGTKGTPVILMTAYDFDAAAMERVRGLASVDYVLKPFLSDLLRSKVAALVALWEQRQELGRRAEALAAKDRDIAMLAHDLQNPLTTIGTSVSTLLHGDLEPRLHRNAERIARTAARMSEMVQSLTDYARAGRGAIPVTPEEMDVGDLCRELLGELQNSAPGRSITLQCEGPLVGRWDRNRLYQATSNLLGNALRHGTGDIEVRARGTDLDVEMSVRNVGPPIPSELLPFIFEPFERGPQTGPGLGLGLFIVREIAKAHHGVTWVTSTEAGTTFFLRLPRRSDAEAGPASPPDVASDEHRAG